MDPHANMSQEMHKAMSSEIRQKILFSLANGEKYLTQLSEEIKRKPQTADFHLNILRDLGIIESEIKSGKRYYFIKNKKLALDLKNHHKISHQPASSNEEILKRLDRIEKKLDKLV